MDISICAGIKDIENRTWKTKFIGCVYIHASGQLAKHQFTWEQSSELAKHEDLEFVYSAIIGHVDIIDCVENHPSVWAEHWVTKDWHNGVFGGTYDKVVYNWVLANPVLYDKPILNVKGKLIFGIV